MTHETLRDPSAGTGAFLSAYVQTRGYGQQAGYAYLGADPPDEWLRVYVPLMQTTLPCVALEQTGDGWRLYVDGIPSVRRFDFAGRRIRYAVILEHRDHADPVALRATAERLITLLLAGIENPKELDAIAVPLDEQFSDDTWVVSKRVARDPVSAGEAEQKVLDALARIQPPTTGGEVAARRADERFLADARDQDARADFLAAARALLTGSGKSGDLALVVNLTSDANVFSRVAANSVVVLVNLASQAGQPVPARVRRQPIPRVMPGKEIASRPLRPVSRLAAGSRHIVASSVRLARRSGTWVKRQSGRLAGWIGGRWCRVVRRNSPST